MELLSSRGYYTDGRPTFDASREPTIDGRPSIWTLTVLLGGFLTLLKIVDEDPQDLPWWAYALGVAVGGLAVALW